MTTNEASEKNVSDIDSRTRRALEEYMTVLPEADGLARVYTESGSEYVVDLHDGACTCPDFQYNLGDDELCKHVKRARFAFGVEAVPTYAEDVEIDTALGRHTDASLRFAASDGGVVEQKDEDEEDESNEFRSERPKGYATAPWNHRDGYDDAPIGGV